MLDAEAAKVTAAMTQLVESSAGICEQYARLHRETAKLRPALAATMLFSAEQFDGAARHIRALWNEDVRRALTPESAALLPVVAPTPEGG